MTGSDRPPESAADSRLAGLYPELAATVAERTAEIDGIPVERRASLDELARAVGRRLAAGDTARLTFICTHNSRRSQMCQIWARTAAHRYGLPGVVAYSGGTEVTALDARAAAALRRAGFRIDAATGGDNPIYRVRFSAEAEPVECFSKLYDQAPNPTSDFCAVMTCSEADRDCPSVLGASDRIPVPFDDPKAFDGTEREVAGYDERCRQIAREMLYVFSVAASERTGEETTRPTSTAHDGANGPR